MFCYLSAHFLQQAHQCLTRYGTYYNVRITSNRNRRYQCYGAHANGTLHQQQRQQRPNQAHSMRVHLYCLAACIVRTPNAYQIKCFRFQSTVAYRAGFTLPGFRNRLHRKQTARKRGCEHGIRFVPSIPKNALIFQMQKEKKKRKRNSATLKVIYNMHAWCVRVCVCGMAMFSRLTPGMRMRACNICAW